MRRCSGREEREELGSACFREPVERRLLLRVDYCQKGGAVAELEEAEAAEVVLGVDGDAELLCEVDEPFSG